MQELHQFLFHHLLFVFFTCDFVFCVVDHGMNWRPKRAPVSDSGFYLLSFGFAVSEAEVCYLCTVELLHVLVL